LNGEYDQSGLAKRVVKAFDDAGIEDAPHLYVAQTGTTVVFKGNVHSQQIIDDLKEIAVGVDGAKAVDTSQVHIV
jgi:osmotically-inducible protein OsmY